MIALVFILLQAAVQSKPTVCNSTEWIEHTSADGRRYVCNWCLFEVKLLSSGAIELLFNTKWKKFAFHVFDIETTLYVPETSLLLKLCWSYVSC